VQEAANEVVHALALEHERDFVDGMVNVLLLDDGVEWDVAEEGNLAAQLLLQRLLAAADKDLRGDADFAELGDGLLGGLGLEFAGGLDERDVGDVDEDGVVRPCSRANSRMASRNGSPSMSPVVPPISVMSTSALDAAVTSLMRFWISSVTCGMTWTVLPR
jgi:hypothetical protein